MSEGEIEETRVAYDRFWTEQTMIELLAENHDAVYAAAVEAYERDAAKHWWLYGELEHRG